MSRNSLVYHKTVICISKSPFGFTDQLVNNEDQSVQNFYLDYSGPAKQSIADKIMRRRRARNISTPMAEISRAYKFARNQYEHGSHICVVVNGGHELVVATRMLITALTTGISPVHDAQDTDGGVKVPIKLVVVYSSGSQWDRSDTLAIESLCSVDHTLICLSNVDSIQSSWTTRGKSDLVVCREFYHVFINNQALQRALEERLHQWTLDRLLAYQTRLFLDYDQLWREDADYLFNRKHTWEQEWCLSPYLVLDSDVVYPNVVQKYRLVRYKAPAWSRALAWSEIPSTYYDSSTQFRHYNPSLEWTVWSATYV